jgi:tRNA threonylcarbamoyl adenosine modification protein YjeE
MPPTRSSPVDPIWRIDLPSLQATEAFAGQLAEWLRPGDFLALSGDLGVGKTAFARSLIRSLAGDPSLEAPSPTFTLMQIYDGPGYPIVHADFYRIRHPDEVANLGWDEAIEGALVLVEWPQRAEQALKADRLEIDLAMIPELGAEARRATLVGHGAFAARVARARGAASVLAEAGWGDARRVFMQGDASIRAYEKLIKPSGETAILMISPPRPDGPILRYGKPYAAIAKLADDIRAFLAMAEGLRAEGLSTPRVYAHSIADGLAVLEDLGDQFIAGPDGPIAERYGLAVDLLAELHSRALPTELPVDGEAYAIRPYDAEAMLVEVELALDWYAPYVAKITPASGARAQFLALWREALAPVLAQPSTWTLRDYHSPNLLWLPERVGLARIGLIDFQDCVLGPPAYDLAALLQDARVDVGEELELKLMAQYTRQRLAKDPAFAVARFAAAYAAMGAQRATKILGIFARLDRRDGKPQYLAHLPRIERILGKSLAHPLLSAIKVWHQTHLPQALGPEA